MPDKPDGLYQHASLWRDKIVYTNFLTASTPVLPLEFAEVIRLEQLEAKLSNFPILN